MKLTGNEPVLPKHSATIPENYVGGMTIRQQMAMQAMQGLNSNPAFAIYNATEIARKAVTFADELINALNRQS